MNPTPPAAGPIRVLIADDHALVREGLRKMLDLDDRLALAGQAASAAEVLAGLQAGGVDLLLLDLLMPGCTGVDLIERVAAAHPGLPVLVLTMHADPHIARRALKAGALGYLTKDVSPEQLIDAIHRVATGRSYVDPSLSAELIRAEQAQEEPMALLSTRERQVLIALVKGRSPTDIAAQLQLAPNTVSTYKARLMEKLGQDSLSDLVRYALRHGLVD
ncbi:response regulator transcription factor [Rhizobacter sp. SG703]|uniref:response regulator n=1 Tax=Rhizobacter sp. SG703 TaxID=2587140 RepID=UPI00144500EB|nr:response regulator transcription factor [Rhizobacter sp. SG703]NKI97163.1 DNA-binding NarL/FixJ family response regulator [Rhizobacter sp. SG703]